MSAADIPAPSGISAQLPAVGGISAERRAAAARWRTAGPWRELAAWPVATAGAVLVAVSYSIAATGTDNQESHFAVFWIGVLMVTVPTFVIGAARSTPARTRMIWVLAYAVFTFVPKLLRNPSVPLYYDEVAHWRQTTGLAASGHLFQSNALIGIVADFPGLHIVTATLADATGFTAWHSAEIVLVLVHVAALFGAVALGQAVFGSLRAGAVTGLFYSLNSSFMYFDTEFGYESLGVVFFIWCLACVGWTYRARTRRRRLEWAIAAAILSFCVVPIHHLSSLFLFAVFLFVAIASLLTYRGRARDPRDHGLVWARLGVGVVLAATTAIWFTVAAPHTYAYLSPYFNGGLGELGRLWSGTSNGRSLYSATSVPGYEQVFAFASPIIAGLLALAGLIVFLRRHRHPDPRPEFTAWSPMRIGLSAYGLLYFASLPLILTSSGAEGARRSWGFTYLGLAVLVTPIVPAVVDHPPWRTARARLAVRTAAVCAGCIMLIGNVSAGLDEDYRFPGPYVYGSDTRSVTPELLAAADWLARNVPGRQMIVADRYAGLGFVRQADAWPATPSGGFPSYDLYFNDAPPSADLIDELASSHYTYLIVDDRMAHNLPAQGEYFAPGEPTSHITQNDLDHYLNYPWTTLVYRSHNYSVYRFDFSGFGANTGVNTSGSTP
jgi:hypothetical protein